MTKVTNDWLKWFDSWAERCLECGNPYKHLQAADNRSRSHRQVTVTYVQVWVVKSLQDES